MSTVKYIYIIYIHLGSGLECIFRGYMTHTHTLWFWMWLNIYRVQPQFMATKSNKEHDDLSVDRIGYPIFRPSFFPEKKHCIWRKTSKNLELWWPRLGGWTWFKIWVFHGFSKLSEMWFQHVSTAKLIVSYDGTSSESKIFAMDPNSFLDQLTKLNQLTSESSHYLI